MKISMLDYNTFCEQVKPYIIKFSDIVANVPDSKKLTQTSVRNLLNVYVELHPEYELYWVHPYLQYMEKGKMAHWEGLRPHSFYITNFAFEYFPQWGTNNFTELNNLTEIGNIFITANELFIEGRNIVSKCPITSNPSLLSCIYNNLSNAYMWGTVKTVPKYFDVFSSIKEADKYIASVKEASESEINRINHNIDVINDKIAGLEKRKETLKKKLDKIVFDESLDYF